MTSASTARRIGEVVASGPVIGALWVLALTARAFSVEDDRVLGVRASALVELAKTRFADDVRGLTWAFIGLSVAMGAAIGVAIELLMLLRQAIVGAPSPLRTRIGFRVVGVVVLHALVFLWAAASMPPLYVEVLYARPGGFGAVTRTLHLLASDVLGPTGVVMLGIAMAFACVTPSRSRARALWAKTRSVARRVRSREAGAVGVGVVCVGAMGAILLRATSPRAAPRHGGPPNVLIIAADSLRDDRLNAAVAPHLTALAARGARFSRAYVTLPRTLPSWTTILTGREPHRHGLRTMFPRYEDRARDLHALPSRLSSAGYRTGVVGDYAADIFTRIRYGFDTVDAPTFNFHTLIATRTIERATPLLPLLQGRIGRSLMPPVRELNQAADPRLVADGAVRMIDQLASGGQPFMLTVFFSTAHFPYAAPAPWYRKFADPSYRGRFKFHKPNVLGQEAPLDREDEKQVRALYDGAVASIDDAASVIIDALATRGMLDDTIVVITADHGEMLYENGHGQGHGDHLFGDEVVHVPLAIVTPPGMHASMPKNIGDVVRDVDLAPTLLDLLGMPIAAGDFDGRSLRPLLEGRAMPVKPAFAETEIWMTETIAELPSSGPTPLRLPYPNVAMLTELDPRLGHDVVMRREAEDVVIAGKHRMMLSGDQKLVYVPTRKGPRYLLFDRSKDPGETHDFAASRPEDVARLRLALAQWMKGDPRMEERDGMLFPRGGASTSSANVEGVRVP